MTAGQIRHITLLAAANDETRFVTADGTILNLKQFERIKNDDGSHVLLFRFEDVASIVIGVKEGSGF